LTGYLAALGTYAQALTQGEDWSDHLAVAGGTTNTDNAAIAQSGIPDSTPVELVPSDPQQRLIQLEAEIQEGLDLVDRGKDKTWRAVAAVRSEGVWKIKGHSSFETYCKSRWGWEKSNAHEVANAGAIASELVASGVPESDLPESIAPYRQLAKRSPEQRPEALREVADTNGKPTAKAIKTAVARHASKKEAIAPPSPPPDHLPVCRPSVSPAEFNREMTKGWGDSRASCRNCRHRQLKRDGGLYGCGAGEFVDLELPIKQDWAIDNEGCKNYKVVGLGDRRAHVLTGNGSH